MKFRTMTTGAAVLALCTGPLAVGPAIAAPAPLNAPVRLPGPQAISETDRAVGAKADAQLSAEYGGVYQGPQSNLVSRVGLTVARQSGVAGADRSFKFTLLNSGVPNAFAVPGGYVYCTRGLLALMNDEAELAFVLGHEAGHITGRHSEKRGKVVQRNVLLGTLGQTLLGAVLGRGAAGQLGGQIGQAGIQRLVVGNVMSHSRAEEFEADDYGVAYMAKAGYDSTASSSILSSLAAQSALDTKLTGQARTTPSWAMSHPDPSARVSRSLARARAQGIRSGTRSRDAFLLSLQGMLYGDDPQQGVIDGQTFKYPADRIQFTAPAGYGMSNGTDAVTITSTASSGAQTAGTGRARFTGGRFDGDLAGVVGRAFMELNSGQAMSGVNPVRTTIGGMDAATATAVANDSGGNTLDVTVVAVATAPGVAYSFSVIQPRGRGLGDLAALVGSFRKMSASEAAAVRPRVIDVVTVGARDTVAALAARMVYPDRQMERFLVLNGLAPGTSRIAVGSKVKLVVWGAPSRAG
ncbi:MAG: M48 family metalloprotease [Pseudomonadota bacterium]